MKKKLEVIQEEIADCGVCSLLSIIRYYNGNASLEDLRIATLTDKDGVTAFHLIECAKTYGFDAIGKNIDYIERNNLPYIAHLNINQSLSHFVVVYSFHKNEVIIMDPAIGFKKINIEEFKRIFSGNIILLNPKKLIYKNDIQQTLTKIIHTSLQQTKIYIALIIFLSILLCFLSIIDSTYVELINLKYNLVIITIVFIIIIILKSIVSLVINKLNNVLSYNSSKVSFNSLTDHLFKLPLEYIHIKDSNEIVKRVNDFILYQNNYIKVLFIIVINSIEIIPVVILFLLLDWRLFLTFIVYVIINIIYMIKISKKFIKEANDNILCSTDFHNHLINYVNSLTSINHSSANIFFKNNINSYFNNYLLSDNKIYKYNRYNKFVKDLLLSFYELFFILISVILYRNNEISVSTLIILNLLSGIVISSSSEIIDIIPSILYFKRLSYKINEYLNINPDKKSDILFINGDIKFQKLSFSYDKYNYLLNNFNLEIKSGDKILLKGKNGSGKSTICRLLFREYDDYKGNIFINNIDIKNINIDSLRENIAYSSQNESLIIGTIKDNIIMGRSVTKKEFDTISRICCLDYIVGNKPFLFDTFLYGGEEELSGGEKQLIFLARSLVGSKSILILDETLSEVNESLETNIIKNILKYYKNKTIIIITHKKNLDFITKKVCM